MANSRQALDFNLIENQCCKDGLELSNNNASQLKDQKQQQINLERQKTESDQKFQKDWTFQAKKEKLRQQKSLHKWYTDKISEKKQSTKQAHVEKVDFAKNGLKFFDRWGSNIKPQHKVK